eukprot:gene9496-19730_t
METSNELELDHKRRASSPPRSTASTPSTPIGADHSPRRRFSTPVRKQGHLFGDRFIPSRTSTSIDDGFDLLEQDEKTRCSGGSESGRENQGALNNLIRSELLGQRIQFNERVIDYEKESPKSPPGMNLLRYSSEKNRNIEDSQLKQNSNLLSPRHSRGSSLGSSKKPNRKINRMPFKVLDAPSLQDDFYLNLVDWSPSNVLSVGLGHCVYLWSASTSKVTKLFDFEEPVTSVTWSPIGSHLAVGTNSGKVLLWDAIKCQQIQELGKHNSRVGSLAWNTELLASGSRDKSVFVQDALKRYTAHKQEVCGLKWSPDEKQLATGGNDNKLFVWDIQKSDSEPLFQFTDHIAAVKAIAWSPHQ